MNIKVTPEIREIQLRAHLIVSEDEYLKISRAYEKYLDFNDKYVSLSYFLCQVLLDTVNNWEEE